MVRRAVRAKNIINNMFIRLIKILQSHKNKPAFTLVEVVAVLFVIAVGLIGVLSLIVQNIQSQNINKNSITAYQLAQEGLELVRNVRDDNWLASEAWNRNLNPGFYFMDYRHNFPLPQFSSEDAALYQNTEGFFIHEPGEAPTVFRRVIEIQNINADSIRVFSRVSWTDRDRGFSYELETLLYDWYYAN